MDQLNWITFNELCTSLRISPRQAIALIRQDKIKYISWGRSYRTHYRYVDPGDDPNLHMQATGEIEFDLKETPLLSSAEIAEIAGVSDNRVRALVRLGHLKPHRVNNRMNLFTPVQVRDILLKRERRTPSDRKPRVEAMIRWFLDYYQREHAESLTREDVRREDEVERMLNRLMRLKGPQRKKAMREFWLKIELAKHVAKTINEKSSDGG